MAARVSERPSGRERVLSQLVAHVRKHGLPADPSLRYYADRLNTSHRMLAYYFGSREQMLATVLAAMRADEREALWSTAQTWSLRDAALAMWAYYSDPRRVKEHQAFFYVFSRALEQPEKFADFLGSLDAWVELAAELAMVEGDDRSTALQRAQLLVSAVRGLLVDRLASSSPERVDAAFTSLIDAMFPSPRRPQRPRVRSRQ
jgi:AcrR family transcriptional regulator